MRWSHHVLLLAMFVHREMENLDPNSLDHALYSGRAQNSIKPEHKESLYNQRWIEWQCHEREREGGGGR